MIQSISAQGAAFRLTLLLTLLCSSLASASTAPLSGRWSGSFTVGQEDTRQLAFNLVQSGDSYTATLDLPSQGSAGILVNSISLDGDEITMVIRAAQAEFYGTLRWNEERTKIIRIDGDWNQVGEYVAVSLHPETK